MGVEPSGKEAAAGRVISANSQVSAAVAVGGVTWAPPPTHSAVVGAGQERVGGVMSSTVTVASHDEESPSLSVQVRVTFCEPRT